MARTILIVCIGLLLAAPSPAQPKRGGGGCRTAPVARDAATPVDETLKAALIRLREEEKLARDVYRTLGDVHGIRAFRNIAAAEERHMDAVLALLRRFGIEDTVGSKPTGVFATEEFGKLHDELVARGKKSPVEALAVGATIEEMDIADLRESLEGVSDETVRSALENLMRASRNHLRSFTGLLRAEGVAYVPVHLEREAYDAILASGHERGRGAARANGRRGGAGRGAGRSCERERSRDRATSCSCDRQGGNGRGHAGRGQGRGRGAGRACSADRGGCSGSCSCDGERMRDERRGDRCDTCDTGAGRGRGRGRRGGCGGR
jgi:hypothetical protein